jgi:L,D-transpeptidase ErfK/SrfK
MTVISKSMRWQRRWLAALLLAAAGIGQAREIYTLPPADTDLVGQIEYTEARQEDTLLDIAREFSLGQDEILLANPAVDRWMPGAGTKVLLPRRYILPDAPRNGIVLNVPEMRLYYYPARPKAPATQVITYPVSIGRMDWKTPMGSTKVLEKIRDPVWRPPETIKREHAQEGDILPDVVPAGPNNPLGRFAMRLGIPGYLIHGTDVNKAFGIGMRVTHGCVRMYPEDIERLFPMVNVGTPVHIVNQTVKVGWSAGSLYIEVHPLLEEDQADYESLLTQTLTLIQNKTALHPVAIDLEATKRALQEHRGIPIPISKPMES